MKSLLKLYSNVGTNMRASMAKQAPFWFDGPKPPTWQTPGRLQYYRAENQIYLPDEIKWKIQMPQEVAIRKETLMYNDKVQEQILAFVGENIKHDYVEGTRDMNLDLTISEATKLYNAGDDVKAMANSGKLQELHKRCNEQGKAVEAGFIKVMDQLDLQMKSVAEAEQEIYDDLIDSENQNMKRLAEGEGIVFNAISLVDTDNRPMEAYEIVRRAANEKGGDDMVLAEKNLRNLLQTRAHIMSAKTTIQTALMNKLDDGDKQIQQDELTEYEQVAKKYGLGAESEEANDDVNYKQLQELIAGDMKKLLGDIESCHVSQQERNGIYADFALDADADSFRKDLLKHLAGSIVIKEHRLRYQKEQFDRFIISLADNNLKKANISLQEFSEAYSRLMAAHTISSHNYRCHKIDANYDDFGENTIKPLNATIFFYFFSANRSGKTWAQWMLASARYPNDRMRRAYMRFFA